MLFCWLVNMSKEITVEMVRNPKCPQEVLAEVLRRGKNDEVSRYAAENPNCPAQVAIKWRMATGKIQKEDPAIHDIDYGEKQQEDEDLKKLKEMSEGSNISSILISQNNNFSIR